MEGGKYELGEFYNFGHVVAERDTLSIGFYDKVGDRRCSVEIEADGECPLTVEDHADRGSTDRDGPFGVVGRTLRGARSFLGS